MNYRVVYDVLDDAVFPDSGQGLFFLGFALLWTIGWVAFHHYLGKKYPEKRRGIRAGLVVGAILICAGALVVGGDTYPLYREQSRCRAWARGGEFEVVEGPIARYRTESSRRYPAHFEVGGVSFTLRGTRQGTGGFRGMSTAPKSDFIELKDGLKVRIAHRDGRILRVEVGE